MTGELTINFSRNVCSRVVSGETLAGLAALLEGEKEVYVVFDRNVEWFAMEIAGTDGEMQGRHIKALLPIDTSEDLKSLESVLGICRWLLEKGASRQALVVAVGGGITTDMAGFAASIYKRGIRYANVPTTLLAQVDAAIGGKTGVNLDGYKNMVGAIVQPEFTYICPEPLKTLPAREFNAGLAELLKTFLLADGPAYEATVSSIKTAQKEDKAEHTANLSGKTAQNDEGWMLDAVVSALSAETIFRAASIKAGIVQRDPYERGERAKLNLGHTFAHAIEHEARMRGDDIRHGEAVAIGIVMAAEMAERLGVAEKGLAEELRADFKAIGLPTECQYTNMEAAMAKDKKATGGGIRFILPVRPGTVIMKEIAGTGPVTTETRARY